MRKEPISIDSNVTMPLPENYLKEISRLVLVKATPLRWNGNTCGYVVYAHPIRNGLFLKINLNETEEALELNSLIVGGVRHTFIPRLIHELVSCDKEGRVVASGRMLLRAFEFVEVSPQVENEGAYYANM